ncbi:RcnB family protein [Paraburkholderia sartisoli]|uniref:Regulator RcnB of Ni and Co efflux n=1 Tax=Paraburkholderia sartisoli TaxID=83784 RepID=A0A1H4HBF7_9BURK|nr:RcnB family protein [Paraburkholderia sartisoli]SEB19025.1 regulator RcnB of Ni and Co efflux [Paraburkholderia sartisoli]
MKSRLVTQLAIVSLLGTSVTVFAQSHDDKHHGPPTSHDKKGSEHQAQHNNGRRPAPHDAYVGREGGPIPHNDWHKGDRLPPEYRDRNYVVDDWHGHGLQAPPRGYQWVGVNGDYVLVAVATGLIANVLLSGH